MAAKHNLGCLLHICHLLCRRPNITLLLNFCYIFVTCYAGNQILSCSWVFVSYFSPAPPRPAPCSCSGAPRRGFGRCSPRSCPSSPRCETLTLPVLGRAGHLPTCKRIPHLCCHPIPHTPLTTPTTHPPQLCCDHPPIQTKPLTR